jgi:hypothetical protein
MLLINIKLTHIWTIFIDAKLLCLYAKSLCILKIDNRKAIKAKMRGAVWIWLIRKINQAKPVQVSK